MEYPQLCSCLLHSVPNAFPRLFPEDLQSSSDISSHRAYKYLLPSHHGFFLQATGRIPKVATGIWIRNIASFTTRNQGYIQPQDRSQSTQHDGYRPSQQGRIQPHERTIYLIVYKDAVNLAHWALFVPYLGSNVVGDMIHVKSSHYGGFEHEIKRNYDEEHSRSRREKRLLAQIANHHVPRLAQIALSIDANGVGCNLPPHVCKHVPISPLHFMI